VKKSGKYKKFKDTFKKRGGDEAIAGDFYSNLFENIDQEIDDILSKQEQIREEDEEMAEEVDVRHQARK